MPTSPSAGLGTFEGLDVITSSVAIGNAGDGLSQAMSIAHTQLHHGQTVYVVLECEVVDVQHPKIKNTESLNRKHKLRAGTATLVDKELVISLLDKQRTAINAAKGIQELDLDGDAQA